jgi:hypothetical protein
MAAGRVWRVLILVLRGRRAAISLFCRETRCLWYSRGPPAKREAIFESTTSALSRRPPCSAIPWRGFSWMHITQPTSYGRSSSAIRGRDRVRIISARRATGKELYDYEENVRNQGQGQAGKWASVRVPPRLFEGQAESVRRASPAGIRSGAVRPRRGARFQNRGVRECGSASVDGHDARRRAPAVRRPAWSGTWINARHARNTN